MQCTLKTGRNCFLVSSLCGPEGVGDDAIHHRQASSDVIAGLLISAVDETIARDARGEFQWSFDNWAGPHY